MNSSSRSPRYTQTQVCGTMLNQPALLVQKAFAMPAYWSQFVRTLFLLALLTTHSWGQEKPPEPQIYKWFSSHGKSAAGEFIRLEDNHVVLKINGKNKLIALADLDDKSRKLAKQCASLNAPPKSRLDATAWVPNTLLSSDRKKNSQMDGLEISIRNEDNIQVLASHPTGGIVILVSGAKDEMGTNSWQVLHQFNGQIKYLAKQFEFSPTRESILERVLFAHVNSVGQVLLCVGVSESVKGNQKELLLYGQETASYLLDERQVDDSSGLRSDLTAKLDIGTDCVLLDNGCVVVRNVQSQLFMLPSEESVRLPIEDVYFYCSKLYTDGKCVVGFPGGVSSTEIDPSLLLILQPNAREANPELIDVDDDILFTSKKVVHIEIARGSFLIGTDNGHPDSSPEATSEALIQLDSKSMEVSVIARYGRIESMDSFLREITSACHGNANSVFVIAYIARRTSPNIRENVVLEWQNGEFRVIGSANSSIEGTGNGVKRFHTVDTWDGRPLALCGVPSVMNDRGHWKSGNHLVVVEFNDDTPSLKFTGGSVLGMRDAKLATVKGGGVRFLCLRDDLHTKDAFKPRTEFIDLFSGSSENSSIEEVDDNKSDASKQIGRKIGSNKRKLNAASLVGKIVMTPLSQGRGRRGRQPQPQPRQPQPVIVALRSVGSEQYIQEMPDLVVEVRNGRFQPESCVIVQGQSLEFRNKDTKDHSILILGDRQMRQEDTRIELPKGTNHLIKNYAGRRFSHKPRLDSATEEPQLSVLQLDNPFFAITDKNGHFKIENIPNGMWYPAMFAMNGRSIELIPEVEGRLFRELKVNWRSGIRFMGQTLDLGTLSVIPE